MSTPKFQDPPATGAKQGIASASRFFGLSAETVNNVVDAVEMGLRYFGLGDDHFVKNQPASFFRIWLHVGSARTQCPVVKEPQKSCSKHASTRRKLAAWKDGMRVARKELTTKVMSEVYDEVVEPFEYAYMRMHDIVHNKHHNALLGDRQRMNHYQRLMRRYTSKLARRGDHAEKIVRPLVRAVFSRVCIENGYAVPLLSVQGSLPKPPREPKVFAGPTITHIFLRELRDELQRKAAKERDRRIYKAQPKHQRLRDIHNERDKRNPAREPEDVECQGGVPQFATAFAVGVTTAAFVPLMRQLKRTVGHIGRAASSATRVTDGIANSFEAVANKLKEIFSHSLWMIPLGVSLYVFTRKSPPLVKLSVAAAAAAIFGPEIWKHVSGIFDKASDVEPQGMGFNSLSKLVSTLAIFSVFKGRFRGDYVGELIKRIALLPRLREGIEELSTWVFSAVECVVNWFRHFFGKERINLLQKTHEAFHKWQRDIDKDCKHLATCDPVTTTFVRDCMDHIVIGYGLKEQYRGHPMYRQVQEALMRIQHAIGPYKGVMQASNNFRFEPSLVMIQGKPGIGKTMLMQHFCITAMVRSGLIPAGTTTAEASAQIWQKGTSDFWNGYSCQKCIVMDDAFQPRVNSTDKENEYINIIRMIGSWAYPLNFADLESKGSIYFNSRLVVGTTNMRCLTAEAAIALNEPEAVIRRISHGLTLQLKPEYAIDGYLDHKKYSVEEQKCKGKCGLDAYPWYIWQVQKLNFATGQTVGEPYPLRQALTELIEDLKVRLSTYDDARNNLDHYVKNLMSDEPAPAPPAPAAEESPREVYGLVPIPEESEIQPSDVHVQAKGVDDASEFVDFDDIEEEEYRQFCADKGEYHVRTNFDNAEKIMIEKLREDAALVKMWLVNATVFATALCAATTAAWLAKEAVVGIFRVLKKLIGVPIAVVSAPIKAIGGHRERKRLQKELKSIESQSNVPQIKPTWHKHKSVVAQAGTAEISRNAYSNSYKLLLAGISESRSMGQVIFINDTLAVEPWHYRRDIQRSVDFGTLKLTDMITFVHVEQQNFTFSVSVDKYLGFTRSIFPERDVSFVNFTDVRAHRNIESNFINHADVPFVQGRDVRLDVYNTLTCRGAYGEHLIHNVAKPSVGVHLSFEARFGEVKVERYIKYKATTCMGDCGAPLSFVDASNFSGRSIIGFHVAGSAVESLGYSTIVTQEMIREARKNLGTINDLFVEDLSNRVVVQSGLDLPFPNPGSFLPICTVATPVTLNPRSSLTPIPGVFGAFGESTDLPAPMSKVFRDGLPVYPMEKALAGYATGVKIYEQKWIDQAVYLAFKPLVSLTKEDSRKLYTFDEAVKGAPPDKLRSIPRGTSAGYPYVTEVRNGKKEFFGFDDEVTVDSDMAIKLRARVELVLEEASKGNRLSHVFMDCLKDELRSAKKVEAVETRLLAASPLDYLVCFRMMFGAFITACMRNHTDIGMAPGINPYQNWGNLHDVLRQKGRRVFDGDFKAFDKSEMPCILGKFVDHINAWYDERPEDGGGGAKNNLIRRVLWLELIHSRHIGGLGGDQRYIYQWNKSLPSGHPCTTIANSLYALFCIIVAYICATRDLTGFWDHVMCVTYGDDNITSPSESVAAVFNQVTVAQHLKQQLDMTYTPGNKNDDWHETMDIEDSTFLKRGFFCENGRWCAPLDIESIRTMAYWNKGTKHLHRDLSSKLESMLMELSLHQQPVWDDFAPKIQKVMNKYDIVPRAAVTRENYRLLVSTEEDFWF